MSGKGKAEKGCVAGTGRGRRIDFLGYRFTRGATLLRKSIKKTFARKVQRIKSGKRRQQVLASYHGWCKWGNCKHLWNTLIDDKNMSFGERGLRSRTTTKDGRRFFDDPEKKMMEILNSGITVLDFETGIKTRNGGDRYAIRFEMIECGERKRYKVITNSFTLKSVLDQAREYDSRLEELKAKVVEARRTYGNGFDISRMNLSREDREMLEQDTPMLPQDTVVRRRDLGGGRYDFYFE